MAETDITLTVGLDPKSINQQVADLRREIQRQMGEAQKEINRAASSTSSSAPDITPTVDTRALDAANQRIQELERSLRELDETIINMQFEAMSNWEFSTDAAEDIAHINNLIQEAQRLQENPALEGTEERLHQIREEVAAIFTRLEQSGDIWERPTEDMRAMQDQVNQLSAYVSQLELQLRQAGTDANAAGQQIGQMGTTSQQSAGDIASLVASFSGGPAGGFVNILNKALKTLKKMAVTIIGITLGVRGIQSVINKIRGMIKEGFKAIYEGDKKFKKQVDDLKKSWAEVKANLAAAFLPIVQLAIPYIKQLLDWINLLINRIAMVIAAIAGQNAYTKAIKATGDAAKGAAKQLSKLDELNNITTSGGGWSTQQVPIDQKMLDLAEKFKALMAEIKAYATENMFEPFKEGFNSAVGDLGSKVGKIKENLASIKDSLIEIFTDPEVQKAQTAYTRAFSKLAGEATGLLVNTGANIGEAITGGISQYLDENKDQIKEDISDTFALATEDADKASSIVDSMSKIVDQLGESEALVDSISNILSTIEDLAVTISQIELISAGWLLDLIGPSVIENVEKLKGFLESLFETISKITGFISMVAGTVRSVLVGLFSALSPLFETIGIVIGELVGKVVEFWTAYIAPILDTIVTDVTAIWNEYVDPILQDVVSVITDLVAMISPVILALYHDVLEPLIDWLISVIGPILLPMFDMIWSAAVTGIKLVLSYLKYIFDTIKMVVHFVKSVATGDVQGAIDSIYGLLDVWFNWILDMGAILIENVARWVANVISIFGGVKDFFLGFIDLFDQIAENVATTLEDLWEKVINTLADVESGLKNFWLNVIRNMVNALNKVIDKINEMLGNIFGKLGETGIGQWLSEHAKLSFPNLSNAANLIANLTVPALAQGAVIPPSMGDFVARLGDNNQETEVVSPLSTMKQAFIEALQQSGGVGGNINIELTVDGNILAQTVVRQNEIYRRQTGRSLLTT